MRLNLNWRVTDDNDALISPQDYLDGLDKEKYEADIAEAGNDEVRLKALKVGIRFFSFLRSVYTIRLNC